MNQFSNKNYFTMPNEIFSLGLDASEIAVYFQTAASAGHWIEELPTPLV